MEKRQHFLILQPQLDIQRLVFVDESGFRLGSSPEYGWAERGKKYYGSEVQSSWKHMTMIGAIALDGIRGLMSWDCGTTAEVFQKFIEFELGPQLNPGDIVVMDNLSSHKNEHVRDLIEAKGASPLFLPPYSPEFNPIEKMWSKLKPMIRRLNTLTRHEFEHALASALSHISNDNILAWTLHAGYTH